MVRLPRLHPQGTRRLVGHPLQDFMANGIDGVWNDMNEPAVFNVKVQDHARRQPPPRRRRPRRPGTHARYHNVYGMLMVKASREGIMAANPDKRPFVLSRANFLGGHRYAATWTGDNSADWYHLETSVPMVLNMGSRASPSPAPTSAASRATATAKLFARWIGFGALLPFARGHTGKGNIDKEPWSFGPEGRSHLPRALERRYAPAALSLHPLPRGQHDGPAHRAPAVLRRPRRPRPPREDDAFLLGDDLLIVVSRSSSQKARMATRS
jgi:alpha-glucosidase